jgi:hypothetical protein
MYCIYCTEVQILVKVPVLSPDYGVSEYYSSLYQPWYLQYLFRCRPRGGEQCCCLLLPSKVDDTEPLMIIPE